MSQVFHLDLFLEHLERVEESTQAFGRLPDGHERQAEVDRAYNGILDASDAIAGYRTLLARDLLQLDVRRRQTLQLVEIDQASLQHEEESDPFRPFLTRPWALIQNIGLFPIRLVAWLFKVRVKRSRDVLGRIGQLKDLNRKLADLKQARAPAAEVARAEQAVADARSAIDYLTEKRSTRRLQRIEHLVEFSAERQAEASPEAAADPERPKAGEIFTRTRQVIARLREIHLERDEQVRQVAAMDQFIEDLPKAAYADLVLRERANLYQLIVETVDLLVEEIQLCRTLTATLDRARGRFEELFPHVAERSLTDWVHDPEARDLLDAVRETLRTLARLTGRPISPNFGVEAGGRTLPELLGRRAFFDVARRTRLERWQAEGGPNKRRELQRLVDVPGRLADRVSDLKALVIAEFERTGDLMAALRHHLGTVSYRVKSPLLVYRKELDDARFERHFMLGAVNKFFAYTIGLVMHRVLALALAAWAVLGNSFHWIGYFLSRGRARRLRAQTEKIVREFSEEVESMADGLLVPGERRADHLLQTDPADGAPPGRLQLDDRAPLEAMVVELLDLYHDLYVSHLTFGTTFLDKGKAARALMRALADHEKRILGQLRKIRLDLDRLEEGLRDEAEFHRKALLAHESAELGSDPDRQRLAFGLARLYERFDLSGMAADRLLRPILESAIHGAGEKRVWLVLRSGYDFGRLAGIVWRLVETLEAALPAPGAALDPTVADRIERTVARLVERNYDGAEGVLATER